MHSGAGLDKLANGQTHDCQSGHTDMQGAWPVRRPDQRFKESCRRHAAALHAPSSGEWPLLQRHLRLLRGHEGEPSAKKTDWQVGGRSGNGNALKIGLLSAPGQIQLVTSASVRSHGRLPGAEPEHTLARSAATRWRSHQRPRLARGPCYDAPLGRVVFEVDAR